MLKTFTKHPLSLAFLSALVFSSCSYQGSTPENEGTGGGNLGTNVSKEDLKNVAPTDVDMNSLPSGTNQVSGKGSVTPPNPQGLQGAKTQNTTGMNSASYPSTMPGTTAGNTTTNTTTTTTSERTVGTKAIDSVSTVGTTNTPTTTQTGVRSGFGVVIPQGGTTPSMGNALTKTQLPSQMVQSKSPTPITMEEKPKGLSTGTTAVGNVGMPIQSGTLPITKGATPSQPVTVGSVTKPETGFGFGFFGGGNKEPEAKKDHIPLPHEAPARCFTVTYKHTRTFGHTTDEECSSHTNMILLKHADVNAASICVRVNGRPVAYKTAAGKNNEIYIGAIAGPGAQITARYCMTNYSCNEDCKVPKDEFMDAIGGGNEQTLKGVGIWEPSDVKDNLGERLRKELAAFDEPDQKFTEVTAFTGWTSETDDALPACKANQVSTVLSAKR